MRANETAVGMSARMCVCVSGVVCVIIIFTARHSHKGHNHIFHQSQQQR